MMPSALLLLIAAAAAPASDTAPLFFTENRGQLPPPVRFMAHGSGLIAWFSPRDVLFRERDVSIRMQFVGAAPTVRLEGSGRIPGTVNFLIGAESDWQLDVPAYHAVVYRGLYPGIDMVYDAEGRNLKSGFIVAPGADLARIRIRYTGAGALQLDDSGALVIPVNGHALREEAPLIYQERGGERVPVAGHFVIEREDTVRFVAEEYDRALPLIIDPVVSYSTLLGGSGSDAAMALATDSAGAAYIAGYTASKDFPTAGPEQGVNGGSNDVFVAKLNPSGSGLVFATYIGGTGDDRANGIAVDSTGAIYLAGSTTSTNFPVRNALQANSAGGKDAFVLKLSAQGNALVYSTYLGGSGSDAANGIAVDSGGNVYIAGDSTSPNFPAAAFQTSSAGGQDAFVAKLNSSGSQLMYSTYLGGNSDDHASALAVDAGGAVHITGSTYSTNFPTALAMQPALAGGQDAFVARLSAAGTALLFSTFLGGTGGALGAPESGQGIALDAQGNVYVTGTTSSADFPLLHPAQSRRSGSADAFIARLNGSGVLQYSTYLGGTGLETGNAITVDASGNAYVAGQTFSSDLPLVGALQNSSGGSYDAFLAKLNPSGDTFLTLSYLGGNGSDTATAIALDSASNIYLAGWTLSTNFPTVNGFQSTNAGNYGAFVTRVAQGSSGPPSTVSVSPAAGSGATQTFTFAFSDPGGYTWISSAQILISNPFVTANACYLFFNRANNLVYLTNDAGTAWQAPVALGGTSTLQNSQCSLNAAISSYSGTNNTLNLTLALSFQASFTGTKNVYMEVYDGTADSGWQQRGTWTVPSVAPSAVSVSPASGSGSTQAFTFTFSDPAGYAKVSSAQILFSNPFVTSNACYLFFNRANNTVYLTNDAATAWQAPVTLGGSGTLQNSQCSLNAAASSSSGTGTTLTLNLAVSFQPSFAGTRNTYMEVYDGTGDSGWQQRGTWTIPGGGQPSAVSVTPSSGSGSTQTFTFTLSDPSGFATIVSSQILFSNPFVTSGACYLYFNRANNTVYLTNDSGTAWQAPVTLGGSGTLQNSQCSVNPAASSYSGTGTVLTLNLAMTFKPAFSGTKKVYVEVYNGSGDSGWQQRGTWVVP